MSNGHAVVTCLEQDSAIATLDSTIQPLVAFVTVGFEGAMRWDTAQPDGTPRKLLDSSRMRALGWRPRISLKDGIAAAYKDFLDGSERLSV